MTLRVISQVEPPQDQIEQWTEHHDYTVNPYKIYWTRPVSEEDWAEAQDELVLDDRRDYG